MKRKIRKLKKKKILSLIVLVVIIIIILVLPKYKQNNQQILYSEETKKIIKEKKLEKLYDSEYSKTLDEIIKNNKLKEEYTYEYLQIKYLEQDDFLNKINSYLNIGYNGIEINNIFKLSINNQNKLLNLEKKEFSKYINIKNFDIDKLERYNDYLENNHYELKDIVTYVNINLDQKFYTNTLEANNPNNLLVLINKYNYLPNNYTPQDIVYVDGAYGNKVPIRSVLKEDFSKLQKAAKEEININLMPTTAFRNQNFQTTLYNNYVKRDGKELADTHSARPGYSEHQTGLAIDLKNTALNDIRLTDDNYEWLSNNVYKYGFIIRYPKNKEFITGYQFENWHIRYVGLEAAKIIYENKLTLEEYIDLYVTEY